MRKIGSTDICQMCGKTYVVKNGMQKRCPDCQKIRRSKSMNTKVCPVCGKSFFDFKSNMTVCCSKKCSSIHRSKMWKNGFYDNSISALRNGWDDFMVTHRGENHYNAKLWVIKSPTGEIYECRNLLNFIRENADLFDGTVRQAYDGFVQIKLTALGKRKKCKSYSWHGWTLIAWAD